MRKIYIIYIYINFLKDRGIKFIIKKIIIPVLCFILFLSSISISVFGYAKNTSDEEMIISDVVEENLGVEYWAVVVGIADYKGWGIFLGNDLPVPKAHMTELYNALISKPNFDKNHVRLLINEEATRSGILNSISWLASNADSDDVVIFSYQGHGHVIKDTNGDESDGMDEGIVPWEGIDGFITDDTLDSRFNQINCKGMYLFFHSCFSGGLVDTNQISLKKINSDISTYEKDFIEDIQGYGRVVYMSSKDRGIALAYPMSNRKAAKGIKTGLADLNRDGKITAEELSEYTKRKVLLSFLALFILIPSSIVSFILSNILSLLFHGYLVRPVPTIYDGYSGDLVLFG